MLVDFGMAGSIRLATRTVDSLGLVALLGATALADGESGLGGALESLTATVPSFRLGKITLHDEPVSLARETSGADATPPWDGLLGLALLSRYTMTFDPTAGRLVLEPID
jgi:hypothetical protein